MRNQVLVINGARTPFMRSGGHFSRLMAYELGRHATNGLVNKVPELRDDIAYLCMGSVIVDPNLSNVAREIVLASLLNQNIPAHTVTMACISSNQAFTSVCDMISTGHVSCGIAGGAETFSDIPIRLSKNLRALLLRSQKAKGLAKKLSLLAKIRPRDLWPDIPQAKEFSTGFSMGEAGDQLASAFNISRRDADQFALLSHQNAHKAWQAGYYNDHVLPVMTPKGKEIVTKDDGPRPDSDEKMLAKLRPAFNRFGINTAANSSFFTDGASAVLLASSAFCQQKKLTALAGVEDFVYAAGCPENELLLGPALSVPKLLKRNGLKNADIGVWEFHEAFAGQVLANLKAISSREFSRDRLGMDEAVGEIPLERINRWGGSLSLGHPFGATGTRLLLTAAKRLEAEDQQYAVVTGCAASGLGSAILLKREKNG